MEFRSHTLQNGLEIVAECNDAAHSSALGFFVKTGARDETDEVSGVSHFLEHMMFKGTPKRTADDVNREFDEIGAHYNAFTSEEMTVYYAAILPEFQDRAVELFADMLRPSLRQEDFETEKQVIIEEIRMYDDQPPFGADDKCRASHFGTHPLGRSILGTVESVGALPVEAMRDYFRGHYCPDNITLAAAGRIDFDRLVELTQQVCGNWPRIDACRQTESTAPHRGFESIERSAAVQEYAIQMAQAPAANDPDRYAAKVLATILGDDSGSRLYWELIDPGRAEQVSLNHYDYEDVGMYYTYLSCAPEIVAENLQVILDVYRTAENDGVTEEEVEQAKNKTNSRIVLGGERPRGRLFTVGSNWIQQREYRTVRDDLDAIRAITPDEILAVIKKFPLSQSTTVAIGPLAKLTAPR